MTEPESEAVTIHLVTKEPSTPAGPEQQKRGGNVQLTSPPGYQAVETSVSEPPPSGETKGKTPDGDEQKKIEVQSSRSNSRGPAENWDCPVCFTGNTAKDPICSFCGLRSLAQMDTLWPDKHLPVYGSLTSNNKLFKVWMEESGSFVVKRDGHIYWDSKTADIKSKPPYVLSHMKDGRLVLFGNGQELWSKGEAHKPETRLVMEDDGRLVFYSREEELWSSSTATPSVGLIRQYSSKRNEKIRKEKDIKKLKQKPQIEKKPFHLLSLQEIEEELKVSIPKKNFSDLEYKNYSNFGLTNDEGKKRLERDGPNALTPPKEKPVIYKFFVEQMGHPLMLLLQVAGILSFVAYGLDTSSPGNLYTAVVLFIAVIISSVFSQIQEGKASDAMKEFKKMLPQLANYVRDGALLEKQNAADLVVGDIVVVSTGDQVPADLRIIWNKGCRVECSSLTGESKPISCTLTTEEKRIQNATNLLFNSSIVIEGTAVGVVYATGDDTFMGEIAKDASATSMTLTPIQRETKIFVRNLSIFAFILAVIFFIIGLCRGQSPIYVFVNAFIVVFVSCVPEGLPMTVTSCLALTARRLAKKHIFIKELRSVETLGSCTVIASDKTGTLTQNRMSVSNLWVNNDTRSADEIARQAKRSDFILKQNSKTIMARHFSQGGIKRIREGLKMEDPGVIYSKQGSEGATATPPMTLRTTQGINALEILKQIICICNSAKFKDEIKLTKETAAEIEIKDALIHADPTATINTGLRDIPKYAQQVHPSMRMMSMRSILGKYLTRADTKISDRKPREVSGEGIEVALLQFAHSITNVELMRYHWQVVYDQPFNSRQKLALCIVKPNNVDGFDSNRRRLLIKGGPDILKKKCSNWIKYGEVVPCDEEFNENWETSLNLFAHEGERVLGFAYMDLDEKEYGPDKDDNYSLDPPNFPQDGYTYVGLIACKDPPKRGVKGAVKKCKTAGLRFMMVTGDYPPTAEAIARQVNIITEHTRFDYAIENKLDPDLVEWDTFNAIVVEGAVLERFTEKTFDLVLAKKEIVFARTIPSQKKAIVKNLQRLGEVVAVTGDGVNDAPALKQADIGLAMGKSGSDCSRAAAAVILMDDKIQSVVVGIKLGRTIFDNLLKTISYTLAHLIPEVVTVLLALAFSYPPALGTLLILVIDLGTELAPAVALAYEESEGDVMIRPPRDSKKESLVNYKIVCYTFFQGGLIILCFAYMAFSLTLQMYGFPTDVWFTYDDYWKQGAPNWNINGHTFDANQQLNALGQAQSAYWGILVGSQAFHIFLCKTRTESIFKRGIFSNPVMIYGVGVEVALLVLILFVPSSWTIFGTALFPGQIWGILGASWLTLFLWHEGIKAAKRTWPNSFVKHLLF